MKTGGVAAIKMIIRDNKDLLMVYYTYIMIIVEES